MFRGLKRKTEAGLARQAESPCSNRLLLFEIKYLKANGCPTQPPMGMLRDIQAIAQTAKELVEQWEMNKL